MTLTHKHHIIPKHMGGTDEPSNLIQLTPEEHAEAHRKLYEEHGHWQDYAAWQGLSGRMSKEEIIRYKLSETHKGKKLSPEHIEILREKGKKLVGDKNPMYGKTFNHSDETRLKISENMKDKNKGNEPWNKGKMGIWSDEQLEYNSSKAKERWASGKYEGLIQNLAEHNRGKPRPESQKKSVAKALSKTWLITSPEGIQQTITNLRQFCRDNNLDQGNLSRGKYKGWIAEKLPV